MCSNINKKIIVISLITGLGFTGNSIHAQSKNFSGNWKRNTERSNSGGVSINSIPVSIVIIQDPGTIIMPRTSVNGAGTESSYTENLQFDGPASEVVTPSKLHRKSTIQWSEDKNSFTEYSLSMDDQDNIKQTSEQRFYLSDDLKELKIAITQKLDRGEQVVLTEVFDRQP